MCPNSQDVLEEEPDWGLTQADVEITNEYLRRDGISIKIGKFTNVAEGAQEQTQTYMDAWFISSVPQQTNGEKDNFFNRQCLDNSISNGKKRNLNPMLQLIQVSISSRF